MWSHGQKRVYLAAKLLEVIDRSRRVTGHTSLPEDDLLKTADAWAELLDGFEPEEIERAYKTLMRERKDRAPLRPDELARTARQLRSPHKAPPPPPDQRDTVSCLHCDGVGYQIAVKRHYGCEYTSARPCVCSACPAAQRSDEPLSEPEWHRDHRGYWRHSLSRFARDPEVV